MKNSSINLLDLKQENIENLQFVKYTYITKKLPDIILGSFKLLLIYLVFL